MAYFAELDENNIVKRVIVIGDEYTEDSSGVISEFYGISYCKKLYGYNTRWALSCIDGSFRKNSAGFQSIYDEELDAFIGMKPYESWLLDEETASWKPPVPQTDPMTTWDENSQSWI
jgi:hypothetical protein